MEERVITGAYLVIGTSHGPGFDSHTCAHYTHYKEPRTMLHGFGLYHLYFHRLTLSKRVPNMAGTD